jgi:hypothetical protein
MYLQVPILVLDIFTSQDKNHFLGTLGGRARCTSALSSLDTNEGARFFLLSFATSLQNTQLVYWAEIDQHQPVDFFS